MMNQLQELFVAAVNSEFLKQLRADGQEVPYDNRTLNNNICQCLESMVTLTQSGETFDTRQYSRRVLEMIVGNPDGDAVMEVFREYCTFQSMILVLREFPHLQSRFRAAGLTSWTRLQVDQHTLRSFAESVIEHLETAIAIGGEFSAETKAESAGFIDQVAELFGIPLSTELRAMVEWCMSQETSPEDSGEDEGVPPRVLN